MGSSTPVHRHVSRAVRLDRPDPAPTGRATFSDQDEPTGADVTGQWAQRRVPRRAFRLSWLTVSDDGWMRAWACSPSAWRTMSGTLLDNYTPPEDTR
jgi:hypothetical protein